MGIKLSNFALVFAPEERRTVAKGETRGNNRSDTHLLGGETDSFAPFGAIDHSFDLVHGLHP